MMGRKIQFMFSLSLSPSLSLSLKDPIPLISNDSLLRERSRPDLATSGFEFHLGTNRSPFRPLSSSHPSRRLDSQSPENEDGQRPRVGRRPSIPFVSRLLASCVAPHILRIIRAEMNPFDGRRPALAN